MKILRKVKGIWVAVALTGVVSTAVLPVVSHAQVSDSQVAFVLSSELGSDFDGKSDLINDDLIKAEVKAALEGASLVWEENSVEDIQAEIQRQEEAGLQAYVVQWGDTLSNIAEAIETDVDELVELNDIENPDLILTGDILDGVLDVVDAVESSSSSSSSSNNESPSQNNETPTTTPGDTNDDDASESDDTPESETPDDSETPEEPKEPEAPKPETPDEPGTEPETPEKPVTPEEPDTDDPEEPEEPQEPEAPEPETPEEPGTDEPGGPGEEPEVPGEEEPTEEPEPSESEIIDEEIIDNEGETREVVTEGSGASLVDESTTTEENIIAGEPTIEYEEVTEIEIVTEEVPQFDENGAPILDEDGKQVIEVVEHEKEVTKEVEKIVPGEDITQVVTTTRKHYSVPFDTIIKYDGTVLEGEDVVLSEGSNGEYVQVTTVVTEDGVVISESSDIETISEAQPKVILRGTMTQHTQQTIRDTYVIKHGVEYVNDPELDAGQEVVAQEGVDGRRLVTRLVTLDSNNEVIDNVVLSEETIAPINEVINVGTKVTEVKEESVKETIPYKTETIEDNTIPTGETRVVTTGQNGEAERTYKVTYANGVETDRVEIDYTVVTAPVNEVVAIGTQVTETKQVTENKDIDFQIVYRPNENVPKGEENIVQEGVKGTERTIYDVTYVNGVEVNREVVSTEVVKAPVNQIVEVGEQTTETVQEDVKETVKFKTEYIDDETLPEGEETVIQEGIDGSAVRTYEVTYVNGVETNRVEVGYVVETEPTKKVIARGTQVTETKIEATTETIPFPKSYVYNSNLLDGERRVIQEGVNGSATRIFEVTLVNGKEVNRVEVNYQVTKVPVKQIIEMGRQIIEAKQVTEDNPIDFTIEYKNNPNLTQGELRIFREGVNGVERTTYNVILLNGEEIEREVVQTEVIKEPISQIIEIGTQVIEKKIETIIETINFEKDEYLSYDLPKGEIRIIQEGVNGEALTEFEITLINGEEVSRRTVNHEVIKRPINQIIEIGAQVIDTIEESITEIIEFETKYVKDNTIPEGEEHVVQEGINGSSIRTYEVTYINGKETNRVEVGYVVETEPTDKIIAQGSQKTETKVVTTTESIAFDTERVDNPDLPKGEEHLVREGQEGSRTIITEITYVNNKETNREVISDVITKNPVNQIIEVGTKEEPVAEDLIIEYNAGDKVGPYHYESDVHINISDILAEGDEEIYRKAIEGGSVHKAIATDSSGGRWNIPIRMDQKTVDAFNDGTIFDHSIFNDRMLELVNELRQSVGRDTLVHSEEYQYAADTRAQEMAEYGSLRFENQPHTRPDNTDWRTVLPINVRHKFGENIAQGYHNLNFYETLSEKALAESFFDLWMKSPGHYTNMISTGYTEFTTAVQIGTGVTPAQGDSQWNNIIAVQIFKAR